ncbi:MAG TPA: hypothetical protein VK308_01615, partial [Pyrinomonadaceae bacterium]|nr:hypothetical protein [Pyrinomonadaceae bacterium]
GQKVAANQKEAESKKPFDVFWGKTTATIGQTVGIVGVANIVIKNPALVTVDILFNNGKYVSADSVTVEKGQVKAHWKVKAKNAGTFTQGVYDAEIRYNGSVPGKTNAPLRIVSNVPAGDFFG